MKKKVTFILAFCLLAGTTLTACQTSSTSESTISTSLSSANSETTISETVSNNEPSSESSTELSDESSKIVSETKDTSTITSMPESSIEESSEEISQDENFAEKSDESVSQTFSMDDVIRYGEVKSAFYLPHKRHGTDVMFQPGETVCVLNVHDDTIDLLFEGRSHSVASDCVELYPEDYIPEESALIDLPF